MPKRSNKTRNIFDEISADDALAILRLLAKEDPKVAKRIEQIAIEYLSDVDIEDIASEVYFELDSIEVEEVWDRSGRTRNGYVEPTEMACQMSEEALEPFVEEMKKYQKLSMFVEAKNYCIGILKGIRRFEKESTSEYKDWAVDAPAEFFDWVLDEWKEGQKGVTDEEVRGVKKAGRNFKGENVER
jgi:hypothetical protein